MPSLTAVPPGRAGRSWLRRRLATAERGREQLDRKLRILFPEEQRLRILADRQRTEWVSACAEADRWLLRAALLGGQDGIRDASTLQPVTVEVQWATTMGLSYPSGAELSPARDEVSLPVSNAAIDPAAAAVRAALQAGVRTAAAEEAVRRLDAEIAVTRRRLRALEKRWLPRLHAELVGLELTLEQTEQEDTLRLRRAAATTGERTARP
ncbi:MAG TPA: V-type ATP synthase subunit D [Candidatus Lustribacter sp.]|nr:V-type ATP synthase subunit D [Candidatus Lustribacter sp.]